MPGVAEHLLEERRLVGLVKDEYNLLGLFLCDALHPADVLELRFLRCVENYASDVSSGSTSARHAVEKRAEGADGLVEAGRV